MGLPNTLTDDWCLEWVLCGSMSLLHITAGLLTGLWYSLNLKCSFHATIWAIFLTAFFGVFWKDNLLSEWPRKLDPTKQFNRCDFALLAQGFDVYVCWSKAVLVCQCTVFLLLSVYISHYFLLLQLDKFLPWPKEHECIYADSTYRVFMSFVKYSPVCLAVSWAQNSFHSLCRRKTTFAIASVVPFDLMSVMGDWKSESMFF